MVNEAAWGLIEGAAGLLAGVASLFTPGPDELVVGAAVAGLGKSAASKGGAGLVRSFLDNPSDFQRVGAFTEPATNRRARGGTSIQEIFENADGNQVIQHTVLDRNGNVIDGPHPRPFFKLRTEDGR